MMKTKGTLQVFAMAAMVSLGANGAEAARISSPTGGDETHELRVVNNSLGPVQIYVQDADGRMHRLRKVARDEAGIMEVSAKIAAAGAFRIRVVPDAPVWSPWASVDGIRTRDLTLPEGATISLWLEMDLRDSKVEIPAHRPGHGHQERGAAGG